MYISYIKLTCTERIMEGSTRGYGIPHDSTRSRKQSSRSCFIADDLFSLDFVHAAFLRFLCFGTESQDSANLSTNNYAILTTSV